jgi:hypothetical protein
MSPRARRSESITLPPGNHPGLIRYNDDKTFQAASMELAKPDNDQSESDLDIATDSSYDLNDSDDNSTSSSMVIERHGR